MRLIYSSGQVVVGGEVNVVEKYIAPTVLIDVEADSPIMREEIFGPILPVLTYREIDDVIRFVNKREKPLALYYFGPEREAREVLNGRNRIDTKALLSLADKHRISPVKCRALFCISAALMDQSIILRPPKYYTLAA